MHCYNMSVKQVQLRLRQQRGKKHGVEYVPWFTVQEVGSIGCVHQFACSAMGGRDVHLLANTELATFLYCLLVKDAVEIREQFPLHVGSTARIADSLGIHHPKYKGRDEPAVLTTDAVATYKIGGEFYDEPMSIKSCDAVRHPYDDERFRLESTYWAERGATLKLVLSHGMNSIWARNLRWLFPEANWIWANGISKREALAHDAVLEQVMDWRHADIASAYMAAERVARLRAGEGLSAFRQLVATRVLAASIDTPCYRLACPEQFSFSETKYAELKRRVA
ncbi:TnsA endonuclease N-terminal domain-containing protein [Paraburkholderia nemoris]|uniref:hypothetical protein n=1 Tax=Paraburkholderia nemoris TaxID=2793076 RepID=UPI0038B86799